MARTKKFITGVSDERLAKFTEEVRNLIKKGKHRGFVTQQELLKAMPAVEEDVLLLDEIYTLFMDLGIEVIDVKDSMIWGDNAKKPIDVVGGADDDDTDEEGQMSEDEKAEKEIQLQEI